MRLVSGWSGACSGRSEIISAACDRDCLNAIISAKARGYTIGPLGGSNSFGDSIINDKHILLDCRPMNSILAWDSVSGIVLVEAGVTVKHLLHKFMPIGWVPFSIPGVLSATIAGCVANNVHGKDSISAGNFGRHVKWLDLMCADGSVIRISSESQPDLFRATIGGIGLTGIILRVGLQLRKIPSAKISSMVRISCSIEETYANLVGAENCDYAQVWLDAYPSKLKLGRGITMLARFVNDSSTLELDAIEKSLKENTKLFGILPAKPFWRITRSFFYPPFMPLVNSVFWRKAKFSAYFKNNWQTELFSQYYFAHNNIPDFYSVYRPPGFLEIQALLPFPAGSTELRNLLRIAQRSGITPVLSGMKKAIPDDFYLSFQGNGVSISLDFPVARIGLKQLEIAIRPLFDQIADYGGRVNLSKDQTMPRDIFRRCYPQWSDFWQQKCNIDPDGIFSNDMARRLFSAR
jgi:decaprenylphospho-beta-D-ribofuranose 2-oxidase